MRVLLVKPYNLSGHIQPPLGLGYLATAGRTNYNLLGDYSANRDSFYSAPFFLKYLFSSWFYFLVEPLLWNIRSLGILIVSPIMIFWYLMLFASVFGFIEICRIKHADRIFPSLIFVFLWVTAFGMSVANLGTVIRFRDVIMPIIVMLGVCGLLGFTRYKNISLK